MSKSNEESIYDASDYIETTVPEGMTEDAMANMLKDKAAESPQSKAARKAGSQIQALKLLEEISQSPLIDDEIKAIAQTSKEKILKETLIENIKKPTRKISPLAYTQNADTEAFYAQAFKQISMPELKENVAAELADFAILGRVKVTDDYTFSAKNGKKSVVQSAARRAVYAGALALLSLIGATQLIFQIINGEATLGFAIFCSVGLIISLVICAIFIVAPFTLRKRAYKSALKNPEIGRAYLRNLKEDLLKEKLTEL